MGEFGAEFVNVGEGIAPATAAIDVVGILSREVSSVTAKCLYLPPHEYQMSSSQTSVRSLPVQVFPDGVSRHVLLIPEQHTLWFARGAHLRLDGRVAVVVRGAIRADPTMIFSLPDVRALRPGAALPVPDPATVPSGEAIVRIESDRVRAVYPEWFGAASVPGRDYVSALDAGANTRAIQACVHAACRDRVREGKSLVPLPIVLRGIFCIQDTIDVMPDVNGRGALWLRGNGDASSRNAEIPSLTRYRRSAALRGAAERPSAEEREESALLRVDPRVSLEVEGVGFRCIHDDGDAVAPERDVRRAVLLREGDSVAGSPPERHAFFDRCGLTGGRDATVGIYAVAAGLVGPPRMPGPGGERSIVTAATRYAFHDCSFDGALGGTRSSRRILDVALPPTAMVDLTGGVVFQVRRGFVAPERIHLEAGLHLRGGSALVRSVSFHLGEGPRPSKPEPLPGHDAQPDGQDIWLDAAGGAVAPHLTVLHADSQSWWFLGGTGTRSDAPGAVSLVNVGAGDVNLVDALSDATITSGLRDDPGQLRAVYMPPSIAWPGGTTMLLLEACLFRRYATVAGDRQNIVNVGTSFYVPLDTDPPNFASNWFPPSVIPRPTDSGTVQGLRVVGGHLAGRPIPSRFALRSTSLEAYYPLELPQIAPVP